MVALTNSKSPLLTDKKNISSEIFAWQAIENYPGHTILCNQYNQPVLPTTKNDLKKLLLTHNIKPEEWDKKTSKSLRNLFRECSKNIIRFSYDDDRNLYRNVGIARIQVCKYHPETGEKYILKETAQRLIDTKERVKHLKSISSQLTESSKNLKSLCLRLRNQVYINKKVQRHKSVSQIARDAIHQELGIGWGEIDTKLEFRVGLTSTTYPKISPSYNHPNFKTVYTFYNFYTTLDYDSPSTKELYVEVTDTAVTFFRWQLASS